jgi:hypothetical protein
MQTIHLLCFSIDRLKKLCLKHVHIFPNRILGLQLFFSSWILFEVRKAPSCFSAPRRAKRRSGRAEESLCNVEQITQTARSYHEAHTLAIQERSKTIAANKKRGSKTVSARRRHKIYTNLFMTFLYTQQLRSERFVLPKRQTTESAFSLFCDSSLFLYSREDQNLFAYGCENNGCCTLTGLFLGVGF